MASEGKRRKLEAGKVQPEIDEPESPQTLSTPVTTIHVVHLLLLHSKPGFSFPQALLLHMSSRPQPRHVLRIQPHLPLVHPDLPRRVALRHLARRHLARRHLV